MGSVNFLASLATAVVGPIDPQALAPVSPLETTAVGGGVDAPFENLFAALLISAEIPAEAGVVQAPAPLVPEEPKKKEEQHQDGETAVTVPVPVFFTPPPPLPLDLLHFSLPRIGQNGEDAPAPKAEGAVAGNEPERNDGPPSVRRPAVQSAAFEGRLFTLETAENPVQAPEAEQPIEIAEAAPRVAPAPPPPAKPAPRGVPQVEAAVPAPMPLPEKNTSGRKVEPSVAVLNEPQFASQAGDVPAAAPERPAAPVERAELPEPPAPLPASHGISVRLGDDAGSAVHLRVAERSGEIHFDVRAASPAFAGTLREGLPELVRNLQTNGYQTEIWQNGKTVNLSSGASPGSGNPGGDLPGERRRRDPESRQANRNPARRKSNFASAL